MNRVIAEPFDHRVMDHTLQATPVDGKLRHLMAGIESAFLVPDLLTVAGQIKQFVGADGGIVEPIEQTDAGQPADPVRPRIYANAELAEGVGLFVNLAIDAARPQHERGGEATDTAADDDRLHGQTPTQPR